MDGPYEAANSTRSELGGFAAAMVFYGLLLATWKNTPICSYRWVCDSKAALSNVSKVTDPDRMITKQPNHADYIGLIKETVQQLPTQIEHVWVKGHRTKLKEGELPTRQSDINHNNTVDQLATWYREQKRKPPQSKEQTEHDIHSIISISINKQRLVSNVESTIRYHADGYQLRQYTQEKDTWSNSTWSSIDFEAFGRFYNGLPAPEQDAFTKFMFGHQSVGTNRYKTTAKVKDPDHLLFCTSNPVFEESVTTFQKALKAPERRTRPLVTRTNGSVSS